MSARLRPVPLPDPPPQWALELIAQVRALRADLAARVRRRPDDESVERLLVEIARAVPANCEFTVSDLMDFAALRANESLQTAIMDAVGDRPGAAKRIGKLLRRCPSIEVTRHDREGNHYRVRP